MNDIDLSRTTGLTCWQGHTVQRLELVFEQPGLDGDRLEGLARSHLTDAEREYLEKIRSPKRRREWVGGRIAIKSLVIEHLWADAAGAPGLADLEVMPDPRGRPVLVLRLESDPPIPFPEISITHTRERAMVALLPAAAGVRLGVDIELIAARSPGFVKRVLTETELAAVEGRMDSSEQLALRWSLKEAAAKAMGMGFDELAPHEVEVVSLAPDGAAELGFLGRAADRYARVAGAGLVARAALHHGHSLAEVIIGR